MAEVSGTYSVGRRFDAPGPGLWLLPAVASSLCSRSGSSPGLPLSSEQVTSGGRKVKLKWQKLVRILVYFKARVLFAAIRIDRSQLALTRKLDLPKARIVIHYHSYDFADLIVPGCSYYLYTEVHYISW